MALDDPRLLREKNQTRLRDMINAGFVLGINVKSPPTFKSLLRIISIIVIAATCGDVYGHICYILRYRTNIAIISENICTFLQSLISILKVTFILFAQRRFYNIITQVSTHAFVEQIQFISQDTPYNRNLRKEAQTILDDCWRNARIQFYLYMIAVISIIVYYFLYAQIVNTYNLVIGNTNHTNILSYPTLYPICENKMNNVPCYAILTFIEANAGLVAGMSSIIFDGTFIFITHHAVALIRILRRMIVFTTSSNVPKKLRMDYLRQCIDHQERTYQYCTDVNRIYLHLSLVQIVLSLLILGVVMFYASVAVEQNIMIAIRMGIYLVAGVFQVSIYCLNGQLISNESDTLSNAWYDCQWYDEPTEFKQLINMMIMRSNRVFHMRASWFSTMSLPTLLGVLRTSGSYFVLLRNLSM